MREISERQDRLLLRINEEQARIETHRKEIFACRSTPTEPGVLGAL
jgi:hypothetical protein